jgi:hypothetical protein
LSEECILKNAKLSFVWYCSEPQSTVAVEFQNSLNSISFLLRQKKWILWTFQCIVTINWWFLLWLLNLFVFPQIF